ncbi:unnamed protein product [Rotaria magnacalcarata]|uniref:Uncharacterized protein n=1 Tax=Rotaria magnacalcarata TaxID=392030 RepID=A0A815R093_9BILA|nr:unnamed protein product [Rotaria magnacalcarata]CAF1559312.1 unnamed protein product [Rotaria magnacalcarata]CAF3914285.1 unnamed protein product [Rotaria magnacalcarata]CAF4301571.1 unnamed protein product [Rotaria magnacalcarata]
MKKKICVFQQFLFCKTKLKKINEQEIFLHAENRLLLNFLTWFEKTIIRNSDHEKRDSDNIPLTNAFKSFPHQILKHKTKQILSIQKKCEIAETTFKVLLGYSQKYSKNATQYVDECINTIETDNEIIVYLEFELIALQRFIQKMHQNLRNTQQQLTAEEFFACVYDRIRYRPELFKEIRALASIRNEFNKAIQQLNHYHELKCKMQDQINLYRQIHTWERKVQIAKRELDLRQIESTHYPEKIIHPWKYLQNPSPTLFYQRYKIYRDRANEIDNTIEKKKFESFSTEIK